MTPLTVGQKIKREREAKGWSQKELAEQADVAPSTISAAENDRFTPSPEVLYRIAWVLRFPFHELVELLTNLDVDTKIAIAHLFHYDLEVDRIWEIIDSLSDHEPLYEYQQDEIRFLQTSGMIRRTTAKLEALTLLYALSYKQEKMKHPNPLLSARIQNRLGNLFLARADYVSALCHYTRALEIIHSHSLTSLFIVYVNIASPLRFFRREREAIQYLNLALSKLQKYRHPESVGSMYYTLGVCYEHLQELPQSELNYRKAIPYYEQSQNKRFAVRCHSKCYLVGTATPAETISVLQDELRILEDEFTPLDRALTTARIAKVYLDSQDLPHTEMYIKKAVTLSADVAPCGERGYVLLVFAKYLMAVQDYEAASDYAFEAADMYASLGFFHFDLHAALALGREAVMRLRASLTSN